MTNMIHNIRRNAYPILSVLALAVAAFLFWQILSVAKSQPTVRLANASPRPFGIDEIGLVSLRPDHTATLNVHRKSTCSSVDVAIESDMVVNVNQKVENTSAAQAITASTVDTLKYSTDGGSTYSALGSSSGAGFSQSFPNYDGTTDYGGSSGVVVTGTPGISGSVHITDSGVCALFAGTGTQSVVFKAGSVPTTSSSNPFSYINGNSFSGHISVTINP